MVINVSIKKALLVAQAYKCMVFLCLFNARFFCWNFDFFIDIWVISLYFNNFQKNGTRGVIQAVENLLCTCLFCKHKVLGSNPCLTREREREREREYFYHLSIALYHNYTTVPEHNLLNFLRLFFIVPM
jgi:hypothetical protein